ncbi:unnamed protein product, partial [Nesidiocoris tenuis]
MKSMKCQPARVIFIRKGSVYWNVLEALSCWNNLCTAVDVGGRRVVTTVPNDSCTTSSYEEGWSIALLTLTAEFPENHLYGSEVLFCCRNIYGSDESSFGTVIGCSVLVSIVLARKCLQ